MAADAGNAYRHQYHDLQPAIIWATAMEGPLTDLLAVVEAELDANYGEAQ